MDDNGRVSSGGILFADMLAAVVVEGVRKFPDVGDAERRAMIELVIELLTAWIAEPEASRASG